VTPTIASAAAVLTLAAACAKPLAPPGGPVDNVAPQIIETVPADLSVGEPPDGPVIFRFDNTLSERGVSDALVMVSPRGGEVRVDRSGSELRVSLEGGWRPGRIYRVVLLPGLRDRAGNERRDPAELTFSTGPQLVPAVIAGLVADRITGLPVKQAIVEVRSRADSLPYIAAVDSTAFFALRHMAVGAYEIRAFVDQNRNQTMDRTESRAQAQVRTINRATDTIMTQLWIVPADTTVPLVTRAEARDSLQVRITTDDWLDPGATLELVDVNLLMLPDSTPVPGARLMSVRDFEKLRQSADTAAPPAGRRGGPPGIAGQRPGAQQPGRIPGDTTTLPEREIVLVPGRPLQPRERFVAVVGGLTNISGLTGGGGRVQFEVPPRPARTDTAAMPPRPTRN
jgi:hypothetical protein